MCAAFEAMAPEDFFFHILHSNLLILEIRLKSGL